MIFRMPILSLGRSTQYAEVREPSPFFASPHNLKARWGCILVGTEVIYRAIDGKGGIALAWGTW
jgi:hypothetical protein